MEYRRLGRTDLTVSVICLGTMQFGWTADEKASFEVMDAYAEAGGNFLDTADIYSSWSRKSRAGKSEEIIGRWLSERRNRERVILATKVCGRMWEGPDGEGLSQAHILKAVEGSLQRLGTEVIDLYQTHRTDPATPHQETLEAMDRLVRQGKVRHIGCSNYPAADLKECLALSREKGLVRFESHQPYYNLVDRREFEGELLPLCRAEEVGVIPYSPLGSGFLTGKYRRGERSPRSERASEVRSQFMNERGFRILETVQETARNRGVATAAAALAWLLSNPAVTSPIIGANSVKQLKDCLPAAELRLSEEEVAALDGVSHPA